MTHVLPRLNAARGVAATAVLATLFLLSAPAVADAQYFGQNKVQFEKLDFKVLRTDHFDIYFYPEEEAAAAMAARMAERWRERLSRLFRYELTGRQPLVLFASHPHFEQTNVVEGMIGESTGGVTEGLRRRMALPFAASLGETDHVIGHELVHAFQYDMLGPNVNAAPLWFIEGMAEYLSVGPSSVHTAMWLRDAALSGEFPKIKDLDDPRYFPYRFGHAFWAYIGGRYGDEAIGRIMNAMSPVTEQAGPAGDPFEVIEVVTERKIDDLSADWQRSVVQMYAIEATRPKEEPSRAELPGVIGERTGGGRLNVGPSLSPDGRRIAFLSERGRLSIEAYVADASTGKILTKLTETAVDPHFQSLQFLASAGAWHPSGDRIALATIRSGRPVLAMFDPANGRVLQEIRFGEIGEIFQPAWSPDGRSIAFSGQTGGVTDLYVHDLGTGQTRRLTNDAFADLQPVWSPDGRRIAFTTDRFTSNLETLSFGANRLGVIDAAGGRPEELPTALAGDQVNPQWSGDGRWIYFISNSGGAQDVYRVPAGGGRPEQLTETNTGVTGITELSPALSVSATGDRMAIGIFRDSGYEILVTGVGTVAAERPRARVTAELPPAGDRQSVVGQLLREPRTGLPPAGAGQVGNYNARLQLVAVGQSLGVGTSTPFGTQVAGGISLLFSDVLGNHLVGTGAQVSGGVRDLGGQVFYLNRARRWYWGVVGEHLPLASGFARTGFTEVDGQTVFVEQIEIFRQTNTQAGLMSAYPFSRASRVEVSAAARNVGFTRELDERIYSVATGDLLAQQKIDLAAPASIRMVETAAAFVRDTAAFGATGPVRGQRARIEVSPTFGDLRLTGLSLDFRQYVMPVTPVTVAVRGVHLGRYGAGGEDERLTPLFIGYSTLVRGYDVGSFDASECTRTVSGACPEFDRLVGSRILVGNLEVRAPLVGLFRGSLDYGGVPVDVFAFGDAGVAWTRSETPTFVGGTRDWVTSAGVGVRANLLGFLVAELNLVRPLNRSRGWMWVFTFRPGF